MCCLKLAIFFIILQTSSSLDLEYHEKNLLDEIIAGNAMKPEKSEAHPDNEKLAEVNILPLKYFFNLHAKEAIFNFPNNFLNISKQVKNKLK